MDTKKPHLWHWPEAFVALAGLVGVVTNVTLALGPLWLKLALIGAYVVCATAAIAAMESRSRRVARDAAQREREHRADQRRMEENVNRLAERLPKKEIGFSLGEALEELQRFPWRYRRSPTEPPASDHGE